MVRWLSPPPSTAFGRSRARALEGPSIGPLSTTFMADRATLLTFVPSFPAPSGPCDPTESSGFLSWGCPKIAPPSTRAEESTPGRFRVLRGGLPHPPAFRPRGFSPPRRLAPLRPRGLVSSRCRSWGSPRFHRLRKPTSPRRHPALRSLPSADSTPGVTTALALSSFTLRSREAGTPGPCSIIGSVVRGAVSSAPYPVLPWAWLVSRSDLSPPLPRSPKGPDRAAAQYRNVPAVRQRTSESEDPKTSRSDSQATGLRDEDISKPRANIANTVERPLLADALGKRFPIFWAVFGRKMN